LPAFSANAQTKRWIQVPVIQAVDMHFPLFLENISTQKGKKLVALDSTKESWISKILVRFYYDECAGDSNETYFSVRDVYGGTLVFCDSLTTIYLLLLRQMPGEQLNSKLIFYNNTLNKFLDTVIDFNISALYNIGNGKFVPSNLKKQFKINTPEIQHVDYDNDKIYDYKLTRLFHNGTSNAIETFILKVNNDKIERLNFERKSLE
jgi:hypothetical protein